MLVSKIHSLRIIASHSFIQSASINATHNHTHTHYNKHTHTKIVLAKLSTISFPSLFLSLCLSLCWSIFSSCLFVHFSCWFVI